LCLSRCKYEDDLAGDIKYAAMGYVLPEIEEETEMTGHSLHLIAQSAKRRMMSWSIWKKQLMRLAKQQREIR